MDILLRNMIGKCNTKIDFETQGYLWFGGNKVHKKLNQNPREDTFQQIIYFHCKQSHALSRLPDLRLFPTCEVVESIHWIPGISSDYLSSNGDE